MVFKAQKSHLVKELGGPCTARVLLRQVPQPKGAPLDESVQQILTFRLNKALVTSVGFSTSPQQFATWYSKGSMVDNLNNMLSSSKASFCFRMRCDWCDYSEHLCFFV